jgi:putative transposase
VISEAMEELTPLVGVKPACEALGVPRSSWYRSKPRPTAGEEEADTGPGLEVVEPAKPRGGGTQPNALTEEERQAVLDVLHSEPYADMSVEQVYWRLLDQGQYLASASTMYRLLRAAGESRERRDQAVHKAHAKPELVADCPCQVWSWDITKLLGPRKWEYYHLYCVIDVYSRFNPAWQVERRESEYLAEHMFADAFARHGIRPGQLTVHADRGPAMRSKTLAQLFSDLDITRSHSRPHVSNDNPYSESEFKTMKYRPGFPKRFTSIEHARDVCGQFFEWYNNHHRHSGIGYHTPHDVHYGLVGPVDQQRQATLDQAWQNRPNRFRAGRPRTPEIPDTPWINRPERQAAQTQKTRVPTRLTDSAATSMQPR